MTGRILPWWHPYVGLPFGEGAGAWHCWGLVCLVYRDQLGIDLPDYPIGAADHRAVHRAIAEGQDGARWEPVETPRAFDVAVMRNARTGRIGHVGVMVDRGQVLHVEAATASVVVPVGHFSVRDRIAGFRRHVA